MRYTKILLVLGGTLVQSINTGVVPFTEDSYALQAPQEIIKIAEQAAALVEFDGAYEVAVPKKAGIQINPWNKFIASAKSPQTKNFFIIINPLWFEGIPQDQQLFLLGRCFMAYKEGATPFSMKVIPYLFILGSIIFMLLLIWLLGKTPLVHKKKWIRVVMAWGTIYFCNIFLINNLQARLTNYIARKNDVHIIDMVVKKTGDKDAAIKALQHLDASIKKELKSGETFFAPYVTLFENYANALEILS